MSIEMKMGECSGCGGNKLIVNKRHNLCTVCNNSRLSSAKPDMTEMIKRGDGKLKNKIIKQISDRGREMIRKDEEFYERIWNKRDHVCEECGVFLGDEFRDENGRVIARYRYSHILTKGSNPKLRHDERNINLLCLKHHEMWERNTDLHPRIDMEIYKNNMLLIEEMLSNETVD